MVATAFFLLASMPAVKCGTHKGSKKSKARGKQKLQSFHKNIDHVEIVKLSFNSCNKLGPCFVYNAVEIQTQI